MQRMQSLQRSMEEDIERLQRSMKKIKDRSMAKKFDRIVSIGMYRGMVNLLLRFIDIEPREKLLEIYEGRENELDASINFLRELKRLCKQHRRGARTRFTYNFIHLLKGSAMKGVPEGSEEDKRLYRSVMRNREYFKIVIEEDTKEGYRFALLSKEKLDTFDRMMEISSTFATYVFAKRKKA